MSSKTPSLGTLMDELNERFEIVEKMFTEKALPFGTMTAAVKLSSGLLTYKEIEGDRRLWFKSLGEDGEPIKLSDAPMEVRIEASEKMDELLAALEERYDFFSEAAEGAVANMDKFLAKKRGRIAPPVAHRFAGLGLVCSKCGIFQGETRASEPCDEHLTRKEE